MPISYAGRGRRRAHRGAHRGRASSTSATWARLGHRAGRGGLRQRCLTADLGRIAPGQAQYTLCCDDDGGVIDDLIAYLVSATRCFSCPNAANTAAVVAALLRAAAPDGIEVVDRHRDFGVLAVQGPRRRRCWRRARAAGRAGLHGLGGRHFDGVAGPGVPHRLHRRARLRAAVPAWDGAARVWDALLDAAGPRGGRPAGLGARDTLRTEMGYPLHGQDLSPEISPVQAGRGWAVGWRRRRSGAVTRCWPRRRRAGAALRGLLARTAASRAGTGVLDADGEADRDDDVGDVLADAGQGSRWR